MDGRTARASVVAALALMLGTLVASGTSSAAVGPPFSCATSSVFVAQGAGNGTQLERQLVGAGAATFDNIGTPQTPYNGIGYRQADNYIYGVSGANQHLLKIDSTGTATDLGGPANLGGVVVGTFDSSGLFDVTTSTASFLTRIDVDDLSTTRVDLQPPGTVSGLTDWTQVGKYLWGQAQGELVRVDPATGQLDRFAQPFIPTGRNTGAAWTYGNGDLGLSDNGSGTIYRIAITNPDGASPTFALVSTAAGPSSSSNDGTSCQSPPVDLAITKTGPAQVTPNGTITWTVRVHNSSATATSSGYSVTDVVPGSVTDVATSTPGCTASGNTVSCVFGVLAPGADGPAITITGKAPASAGAVDNPAAVTGNEADPNPANDTATAHTVVVTPGADVSISKTADDATPSGGQTVTYTLTAHNAGPNTATATTITDTLPAGVTYVSDDGGCTLATGVLTCPVGSLAPGADVVVHVKVTVDPVAAPAPAQQVALDVEHTYDAFSLQPGETKTLTSTCPGAAGAWVATDGSAELDHVDQGSSLGSVDVLQTTTAGPTATFVLHNTATGQAQGHLAVMCIAAQTADGHPLTVSAPITQPHSWPAGVSSATVSCAAGQHAIAPGFQFDAPARVRSSEPTADGSGWTFVVDASAPVNATLSVTCLNNQVAGVGPLALQEQVADVVVPPSDGGPSGYTQAAVVCPDDMKGIVASSTLPAGLILLGDDPQPKSRVFYLYNPTGAALTAHLDLLCVGERTALPGNPTIINVASVASATSDPNTANNQASATITVSPGGAAAGPAPRAIARLVGPAVSALATNLAALRASAFTLGTKSLRVKVTCAAACSGTATARTASSVRVAGRTIRAGRVVARGSYRLAHSGTVSLPLRSRSIARVAKRLKLTFSPRNGRTTVLTVKRK